MLLDFYADHYQPKLEPERVHGPGYSALKDRYENIIGVEDPMSDQWVHEPLDALADEIQACIDSLLEKADNTPDTDYSEDILELADMQTYITELSLLRSGN